MIGGTSGLEDLDELYESIILDHYRNPRNNKLIDSPDIEMESNNPFCGDEVQVQIEFKKDRIFAVSVIGRGCAISQASASLMSELIEHKNHEETLDLVSRVRRFMRGDDLDFHETEDFGDFDALGGVRKFPVRIKCALLSWVAVEDAIEKLKQRH